MFQMGRANNENIIITKRDFSLDYSNELKYGYVVGFIQMSCQRSI